MSLCPVCAKDNPAGTLKCDCGYSYLTGEIVPPRPSTASAASARASGGTPPPLPGETGAPAGEGAAGAEPAPPSPGAPPPTVDYRLEFRGTAREYFGIWIVNTLLKVVTVGFYTAWAKVRTRRYFAGATVLNGEPFEYLAEPKALFRGWLIAIAAIGGYAVARRYSPTLGVVVGGAIFCALPWVIVRSRIFNCRNMAHRNIRFGFQRAYGESYGVYLGLYLLVPLTLGIIYPYIVCRQKRFLTEKTSYGSTPFRFTGRPGDFYVLFFMAGLALVTIFLFVTFGIAAFGKGLGPLLKNSRSIAFVVQFAFVALYLLGLVGIMTALNNLVWNRTELGDIRFTSDMSPMTVIWLYVSGFVAVACSLGLLFPWAAIRLRRYRYDHLTLHTAAGLDGFVASVQAATVGAAGEEIGDVFGLDLDIAL